MTIRIYVQFLTWNSIFAMLWSMILGGIPVSFTSWGWVILFAVFALGTTDTTVKEKKDEKDS